MSRLVILWLLGCCGTANIACAAERPHFVLFISDDHGYADSSLYGSPDVSTPHLDALGAQGMTFTRAFAASPSCAPSRAAFLTGQMPARTGAMLNHQPPRDTVKRLPAYLHELGYEVVAFGKVAHYRHGKDYGFDIVAHDTFHDHDGIPAAVEYLQNRKDSRPLCLCVGTNWPHVPWPEALPDANPDTFTLPPSHVDTPATREIRAKYFAAVRNFDDDLGTIRTAVDAHLGPETIFLHFSDHGAQWPFGKWNLYDEGTRVPLVVVCPGIVTPGSRTDALVSLIDILPTLIKMAGGDVPDQLDGKSFASLLRGERDDHRQTIETTHSGDGRMNEYPIRAVRTARWKYIRNLRPEREHHTHIDKGRRPDGLHYWQSWVERAKTDPLAAAVVHRYHQREAEELYDLLVDPWELRNLAQQPESAEILSDLRRQLDESMQRQGDAGLASEQAAFEALQKWRQQQQPR